MQKSIKILAIGNSFSEDSLEYLGALFLQAGYQKVTIANMYIGGCSLDRHWQNIQNDGANYQYQLHQSDEFGAMLPTAFVDNAKLSWAIKVENWDFVTVQQASGVSGQCDSFGNLDNILSWIRANKTNNDCQVLWHMTWAYQGDSSHEEFPNYHCNQLEMYQGIVSAVKQQVVGNYKIDGIIPSGTAVQNARTTTLGDTLTRDGFHLSLPIGRFLASLAWFATISKLPLDKVDFSRCDIANKEVLPLLIQSVTNAMENAFCVTPSQK